MEGSEKKKSVGKLTELLKKINKGKDPERLREEAAGLISDLTSSDICKAERSLIKSGYSAQLASQLSTAFVMMAVVEGQGVDIRNRLADNHILRRVIAEHDIIRCFVADLEDTLELVLRLNRLSSASSEFMKLAHIAKHLEAMSEHADREQDVIFPYFAKFGWGNICRPMRDEHEYIKAAIEELLGLVNSFDQMHPGKFKQRLESVCRYIISSLTEHMFKEDKILYPIALEVIGDEQVWRRLKAICEEIGYCGVHF